MIWSKIRLKRSVKQKKRTMLRTTRKFGVSELKLDRVSLRWTVHSFAYPFDVNKCVKSYCFHYLWKNKRSFPQMLNLIAYLRCLITKIATTKKKKHSFHLYLRNLNSQIFLYFYNFHSVGINYIVSHVLRMKISRSRLGE